MSMLYQMEPGLYSDVIFSHILYFNIETPEKLESFINPKKRAADMRFFHECLTKFEAPSDELCPFFEIVNGRSFGFSRIYDCMSRAQNFSMDTIRGYLPDAPSMLRKLCSFYLPGQDVCQDTDLKMVKDSVSSLDVSPLVKFHLLSMVIEPQGYYDAFFASLEKRMEEMQAYYKANRAQLEAAKKTVKQAEVAEFLEKCYGVGEYEIRGDLSFSLMLVGKNAVRYVQGGNPFVILGFDYPARMAMLIGEAIQPDIVKIGKALSEEKRVTILQLLLAENEITAQQLLRRLELSMTATHYHLEMLMQAGMLLARNEGRTIYYSLNREFFDRAPMVFDKFNSKEDFER